MTTTTCLVAGKEVEVKRCPFCGSDDVEVETTMRHHTVCCKDCHGQGPMSIDRDYAVHRWNFVHR